MYTAAIFLFNLKCYLATLAVISVQYKIIFTEAKMDNPSFIYCYYAFCAHFGIFHKLNDIVRCSRSIYIVE